MIPVALLAVLIGAPIILGVLLRVNAVYMYVSLLIGQIFVLRLSSDAATAVSAFIRGSYTQVIASMLLLLFPLLLTVLLLKHSITKSKLFLNIPAYIAVGLSLYIFTIPILPSGTIGATFGNPVGNAVNHMQDLVIAGSALVVLATMLLTGRHHEPTARHHKHK